jgi:orotate phosphoribosyltransferase
MAKKDLAKLLVDRSYIHGDFVLASGRRSSFYFDCKLTTCFADAMPLIGEAFINAFRQEKTEPVSVGGLTSGADPIANAIAFHSLSHPPVRNMFSVRKDRKEHGTRKWIEGCAQSPVAVVDDVVTSGGSVLRAIERCIEDGLEIVHVAVLVDREEGGMEAIRKAIPGVPVTALLRKSELDALRAQEYGEG